jgi:hypothetical protein
MVDFSVCCLFKSVVFVCVCVCGTGVWTQGFCVGSLPVEPNLHSILLWLFLEMGGGLTNYLSELASSADLGLPRS